MNLNILHKISYGIYVISTMEGERPVGCIASSVMQVCPDPLTFAVSINRSHDTHSCIFKAKKFAVSVLSEDTGYGIIGRLGFQSGKACEKFAEIDYRIEKGVPIPEGVCGYILCEISARMEVGTHTLFIGQVLDGDLWKDAVPLSYYDYHEVLKGKVPPDAATYFENDALTKSDQENA